MSLNAFLNGAQGSKWAVENLPSPSFGHPIAPRVPSEASFQQQPRFQAVAQNVQQSGSSSSSPAAAPKIINGWVVKEPSVQGGTLTASITLPGGQSQSSRVDSDIHRGETPKPLAAQQCLSESHERKSTHDSGWDEHVRANQFQLMSRLY